MRDPPAPLAVYVVDDDPSVRDSLALLLSLHGHATAAFASAEDFLAAARADWAGCAIVDIRMRGMDGLQLLQEMKARDILLPTVIVTAHGDVASAREREVLDQLLLGLHNRDIATRLGISPRTVEVHKARILAKLGARNVVDLIRLLNRP